MIDLISKKSKENKFFILQKKAFDSLKKWHQSGKFAKDKKLKKKLIILEKAFIFWRKKVNLACCLKRIFNNNEKVAIVSSFYQIKRNLFIGQRIQEIEKSRNSFLSEKYFKILKSLIIETKQEKINNYKLSGFIKILSKIPFLSRVFK